MTRYASDDEAGREIAVAERESKAAVYVGGEHLHRWHLCGNPASTPQHWTYWACHELVGYRERYDRGLTLPSERVYCTAVEIGRWSR